jgi:hypothetical protein
VEGRHIRLQSPYPRSETERLSVKIQFLPIEQSKWKKLTIDTNTQLTLYKLYIYQQDHRNFKNIIITAVETSLLLCSVNGM